MFNKAALIAFSFAAMVMGQQVGTNTAEVHPSLPWQKCTTSGGCVTQSSGKIVLDSNWRWLHSTTGYTNCYTGNTWDATLCPDGTTCAANCALDGADYSGTYGITTSGNALTLKFVTNGQQKNIGSRVYLMASDTEYEMFKVLNQEFTFDVDVSNLPCGLNGALYFSQMDADGGMSRFPTNKAGAKYGTGYCDSQCPRDIKFINGVANSDGWTPSSTDVNAGSGQYGTCCNEMDVWEANNNAAAFTPHPCTVTEQTRCEGDACGTTDRYASVCDPDGCDFNSFRMGDKTFYGAGMTVDTTKKFTVVTQFITDDGTASGTLSEIRRIYVQDGKVIQNSNVNIPGIDSSINSITSDFCDQQKTAFGDTTSFQDKGGLAGMSKGLADGMVLVLSVWDDHAVNMLWLDSDYPTDADPSTPGIARGTCSTSSGKPTDIETSEANASVTYSNIRFGDLNSTYSASGSTGGSTGGGSTNPTTTVGGGAPTTTVGGGAPGATQSKWGQCGGQGWSGPTACASGSSCQVSNPYYSQCL
ncbi:cellobiohydrolase I [Agrocybe pediades]|nr:cellobiohydrolase I [Agrocybe pediades]